MKIKLIIICVVLMSISACSNSHTIYQGPNGTANNFAYLKDSSNIASAVGRGLIVGSTFNLMTLYEVHIIEIDGNPRNKWQLSNTFKLNPGKHQVTLACVVNIDKFCGKKIVTLDAMPGHTYLATINNLSQNSVDFTAGNYIFIKDLG